MNIDKTKLSPELVDLLDLIITPMEDNSWLIEIKFKELKRTNSTTYKKIINLVYTVDPELPKGSYDAVLKDLDLELNDGTCIIEALRIVPLTVERYGTNIDPVSPDQVNVSVSGQQLVVESESAEIITIYTVSGVKIQSFVKEAGIVLYDLKDLRDNVLIINGSSGWNKKIIIGK